jgi:hypothetical protein
MSSATFFYLIKNGGTAGDYLSSTMAVCVMPCPDKSSCSNKSSVPMFECTPQPLALAPAYIQGQFDIRQPPSLIIAAGPQTGSIGNFGKYSAYEIVPFTSLPFLITPSSTVSIPLSIGSFDLAANITYYYLASNQYLQLSITISPYNPRKPPRALLAAHAPASSLDSIYETAADNNQCTVVDTDTHTITICKK